MTAATDSEAIAPVKMPVWKTGKAACRDTLVNSGTLIAIAVLPILASLLLESAATAIRDSGLGDVAGVIVAALRVAVSILIVALFELVWLRFLLLSSSKAGPRTLLRPGWRLLPFFGYGLVLALPFLPAFLLQYIATNHDGPVPALTIALVVFAYLLGGYFSFRLSFALLWIAGDAPGRLIASWRATRKNGLRILIATCLVAIPFAILVILISLTVGVALAFVDPELALQMENDTTEGWPFVITLLIGNVIVFAFYALTCATLYNAFSFLTGWTRNRDEIFERFE